MRTIGEQVRDYRSAKGLSTAALAAKVGKKRQHIEQLEAAGNRIPKYIGELATAMETTVDEILATAGLHKPAPRTAPPKGSFLKAPTPEMLELLDHWGHLLNRDRTRLMKEIADLAQLRQEERKELLEEAGLTAIASRAAEAARPARASVEPGDPRLKQKPLFGENP